MRQTARLEPARGVALSWTDHALFRAAQRGIPTRAIQAAFDYGVWQRRSDGCIRCELDDVAADAARTWEAKDLRRHVGACAIVSPAGAVVTVFVADFKRSRT